jgi:formylglycine-generating enzyme required for sulfatase activity
MKNFISLFVISALFFVVFFSCEKKDTVTDLKISQPHLLIGVGKTATITANLLPYDAVSKMNWSSSDNNIVSLEYDEKASVSVSTCVVTAVTKGTAIITVSTKDGKHKATCTVITDNGEPELISVEGGTFTMGCTDGDCNEYGLDVPAHQVTLSSFKIAKYPVTQQQWKAVMDNNPSYFGGDSLPVTNVNWNDTQKFIQKLNSATGKNYRLLTEAEWEFAARGGNKSNNFKYSGSNNINEVAWYISNSNYQTQPVGTKKPNELGIYDMSGNVFEWCYDWYDLYTADSQVNPIGPPSGEYRIFRGGSVTASEKYCRVANRNAGEPTEIYTLVGFRLAHP